MTKIKEIIKDNGEWWSDIERWTFRTSDIEEAATEIEKVHDEEMVGFAEWVCDFDWIPLIDKNKELTTAQLLQLYKNK